MGEIENYLNLWSLIMGAQVEIRWPRSHSRVSSRYRESFTPEKEQHTIHSLPVRANGGLYWSVLFRNNNIFFALWYFPLYIHIGLIMFICCSYTIFLGAFMWIICCPACRIHLIATRFWVAVICPIIKCLTVIEFSFILFDLCLFITIFNFILNYVPIVTFWIFTYHKVWILLIIFCFIWNYWIIYFLTCLEVFWSVVS